MRRVDVWDPLVRIFHWSLVAAFAANALFLDEDGKLHQWVGYFVVLIVVLRIFWGIVGTKYARFSSFPPSLSQSKEHLTEIATQRTRSHIGHSPLGALMIYNLLFALLMIGLSGYLMTTDMFWGVEWPEELHELTVTWAEISVLVHIFAVIYESRRTGVNLPKAMIRGYKELPPH